MFPLIVPRPLGIFQPPTHIEDLRLLSFSSNALSFTEVQTFIMQAQSQMDKSGTLCLHLHYSADPPHPKKTLWASAEERGSTASFVFGEKFSSNVKKMPLKFVTKKYFIWNVRCLLGIRAWKDLTFEAKRHLRLELSIYLKLRKYVRAICKIALMQWYLSNRPQVSMVYLTNKEA